MLNRSVSRLFSTAVVLAGFMFPIAAPAALTVTPVTWNIVGLDSNGSATGPQNFPVGVRVPFP